MFPKFHILFGFLVSLSLYFCFPGANLFFLLIFFLSSFIFDVDHYFFYIQKKHSLNFAKAYKYFRYDLRKIAIKNKLKRTKYLLLPFHLIEFLIIILILSFFIKIFQFIFLGLIIHMLIDWIYDLCLDENDKKYKRVFSIIYYVITSKRSSKKIKK